MPAIEKDFRHIKVVSYRSSIHLAISTEDLNFRFRNVYDRADMDDFDKNVIELALTAIAQRGKLYLGGSYEGDGDHNGPLDIMLAVASTNNNI
ncbi:MAG TPA: hypothetical protein VN150_07315 [Ochrobactrum sp.]|nr:hypothetical protein [Ochrobactrum sp.]